MQSCRYHTALQEGPAWWQDHNLYHPGTKNSCKSGRNSSGWEKALGLDVGEQRWKSSLQRAVKEIYDQVVSQALAKGAGAWQEHTGDQSCSRAWNKERDLRQWGRQQGNCKEERQPNGNEYSRFTIHSFKFPLTPFLLTSYSPLMLDRAEF